MERSIKALEETLSPVFKDRIKEDFVKKEVHLSGEIERLFSVLDKLVVVNELLLRNINIFCGMEISSNSNIDANPNNLDFNIGLLGNLEHVVTQIFMQTNELQNSVVYFEKKL